AARTGRTGDYRQGSQWRASDRRARLTSILYWDTLRTAGQFHGRESSSSGSGVLQRRPQVTFVLCCGAVRALDSAKEDTVMTLSELLLRELEHEAQTTRRLLERVPQDKLGWKPHEKSMSLGTLASHIASTPGAIARSSIPDSFPVESFSPDPD